MSWNVIMLLQPFKMPTVRMSETKQSTSLW